MNLNSEVFENVIAIDERLKLLEQEVEEMDKYYGMQNNSQEVYTQGNYATFTAQEIEQPLNTIPIPYQSKPEIPPQQVTQVIKKPKEPAKQTSFKKESRYQNLPQINPDPKQFQQSKLKPQISKEYEQIRAQGKPDLSLLENEFELGEKFYEPQHMNKDMNIRFRESEAQIRQETGIIQDVLRTQASQFYDSFM